MSSITINDERFRVRMGKLDRALSTRVMLEVIGQDVLGWVADNFRREGIEKPWARLSPSTIASRRKGSSRILQDTGKLRQSFTSRVSGNAVEVGTVNRVAPYHHFGTRPYVIRPVRRKWLRFKDETGATVFSRQVRHPGLSERRLIPSKHVTLRIAIKSIGAVLKQANV